ncbi:unnamed protein product [Brassica oleracea]
MSSLFIYLAKSSLCHTSCFYVIRFWQKKNSSLNHLHLR